MRRAMMMASAMAFAAGWSPSARAAVPSTLTQQGRLVSSAGAPVNGAMPVVFTLYAQASGGTALWTETQSITFDDGYFSTQLGAVTALPSKVFDGTARYLGIAVGNDPEMSPREMLTSVPYAIVAGNVNGDITPSSVSVGGTLVINSQGQWVGPPTGLVGPTGPQGPAGPELRDRRGRKVRSVQRVRKGRRARSAPPVRWGPPGRKARRGPRVRRDRPAPRARPVPRGRKEQRDRPETTLRSPGQPERPSARHGPTSQEAR